MIKSGIIAILTLLSVNVFADPQFSDRQSKEQEKVLKLNYKFQTVDYGDVCKRNEAPSDCYKKQLSDMHAKDKLSMNGIMTALPAGKGLINNEKDKLIYKEKLSTSDRNMLTQKRQAQFAIFLLELSCNAATPTDWGIKDATVIKNESANAKNYVKTLKRVAEEAIEQVRKYSNPDSVSLRMNYDNTLMCEAKK